MAAAWTKGSPGPRVGLWSATIGSAENDTAILALNPDLETTIAIDLGATETVAVQVSFDDTPAVANMQTLVGAGAVDADFNNIVDGAATAIRVTGGSSADSVVRVLQRPRR